MLGFAPLILTALVWLAWRRRDVYRSCARRSCVAIGMAAVVHLTFPVAPPRMIGGLGISDWVGLSGGHDSGSFAGIRFNPYAAMPSMHVGWSLLVGIAAWRGPARGTEGAGPGAPRDDDPGRHRDGQPLPARRDRGAAVALAGLGIAGLLSGRPEVRSATGVGAPAQGDPAAARGRSPGGRGSSPGRG